MPEHFFQRWARLKAESDPATVSAGDAAPCASTGDAETAPSAQPRRPTLHDVTGLASDFDFSVFVAPGLDRSVHHAAMKKLFSDPHFHRMDGLDIYIDDYTKPSPVSSAMLALLAHARSTLAPQPMTSREPALDRRTEPAALDQSVPAGPQTGVEKALCAPDADATASVTELPRPAASPDPTQQQAPIGKGVAASHVDPPVDPQVDPLRDHAANATP